MINRKITIAIAGVLFFIINLNAQYKSIFADTITIWNYISINCDANYVDSYIHVKDTNLSNIDYKLINGFGGLRESENHDKLWCRSFTNNDEVLIMDLNLEVNDTFYIDADEFIVDTIYFEDTLKIIQFVFLLPNCGIEETFKFKEGEGPNLSFRYMLSGYLDDRKLIRCYTRNSITVNYLEEIFGDDCFDDRVNVDELEKNKISIAPNPFENRINIKFETSELRTVVILDYLGRVMKSLSSYTDQIEIDTEYLNSGIYFINIIYNNSKIVTTMIKT